MDCITSTSLQRIFEDLETPPPEIANRNRCIHLIQYVYIRFFKAVIAHIMVHERTCKFSSTFVLLWELGLVALPVEGVGKT